MHYNVNVNIKTNSQTKLIRDEIVRRLIESKLINKASMALWGSNLV